MSTVLSPIRLQLGNLPMPPEEAKRIQELVANGSIEAALDALQHYKRLLLDTLHTEQKELERIDDLLYALRKGRSFE